MRKGIGIISMIVSMSFAGCSGDAAGPDPQVALSFDADSVEIEGDSIHVEWEWEGMVSVYDPPPPMASVTNDGIKVQGVVIFPSAGAIPGADLLRSGDLLEIRVFPEEPGRIDHPGAWTYRAEIFDLPPGGYTLRMRHDGVMEGVEGGVVLDEEFTIPSGGGGG